MAAIETHIGAVERYRDHGLEPGSFTRAVLAGQLYDAVRHADPESQLILAELAIWIMRNLGPMLYGSDEKVGAWIYQKRQEMKALHEQ